MNFDGRLGRGSYGIVYRGRFRGSIVAVKKMELPLHLKAGSETFITEVLTLRLVGDDLDGRWHNYLRIKESIKENQFGDSTSRIQ